MNILVTGADGFVGKAICEYLSAENYEIFKLDSPRKIFVKNSKHIYQADISEKRELEKIDFPQKIDVLIHCAGLAHQFGETAYEDFEKINVTGAANICDLAVRLRVGHFIQISSISVYGSNESKKSITENIVCKPTGFYGLSKLEGERVVREICEKNDINLTILRLATVIGEEDRGNVAKLIRAIGRKRFVWIGRGKNRKSLIYKKDVGRVCRLLVEKKNKGAEIFNLSAEPMEMQKIVRVISDSLETTIPKFHISAELIQNLLKLNRLFGLKKIKRISEKIDKWLAEDVYSADKIFKEYGFKPETDILDAIKRETVWYKNQK